MDAASLITGAGGVVLFAFGYLIGVRQRIDLLANFDPARVVDRQGLARWAGTGAALLGLWTLLAAAALPSFPAVRSLLLGVYLLGLLTGVVAIIFGGRRYTS